MNRYHRSMTEAFKCRRKKDRHLHMKKVGKVLRPQRYTRTHELMPVFYKPHSCWLESGFLNVPYCNLNCMNFLLAVISLIMKE